MILRNLSRVWRFLRDNRGSVSAEAVIVLPLVIWAYLATYEYFDVFGTITRNMKATYTIADLISRQTQDVTQNYIDGLDSLYSYLNHNPQGVWTRVTSIGWDPTSSKYYVGWSLVSNPNDPQLDSTTLQSYVSRLPVMAQGDTLIMVETHMDYQPVFKINYLANTQTFTQTVITRPRISPQVTCSGAGCT
jgi:hypothetical protein